jgi:hypothetical protein
MLNKNRLAMRLANSGWPYITAVYRTVYWVQYNQYTLALGDRVSNHNQLTTARVFHRSIAYAPTKLAAK